MAGGCGRSARRAASALRVYPNWSTFLANGELPEKAAQMPNSPLDQTVAVLGILGLVALGVTVFAIGGVCQWWRETRKRKRR